MRRPARWFVMRRRGLVAGLGAALVVSCATLPFEGDTGIRPFAFDVYDEPAMLASVEKSEVDAALAACASNLVVGITGDETVIRAALAPAPEPAPPQSPAPTPTPTPSSP